MYNSGWLVFVSVEQINDKVEKFVLVAVIIYAHEVGGGI